MTRAISALTPADHAALTAVQASGRMGLSADDIRTILGLPSKHAPENFARRCRDRGHRIRAIRIAPTERGHAYRYIVESAPVTASAGSIRSVTRLVSGEIGMGSIPGTPVSVAYLACLDAPAARATGGEGCR